jgi:hypothetical protein
MMVGMKFISLQVIRIPNEISLTPIKLTLTPLKQKKYYLTVRVFITFIFSRQIYQENKNLD